ncbi:low temperature requirement protein A [Aquipuribacter nitratireducens]|uniref:Low temperature requirement protein A n=1 Tax=Aquipuribacter nitratireducens TaxID=650104 RepID=A0ABW0GHZ0_9MICO
MSLLVPSVLRDPDEPHRAATPLELLFDLCFVVAVALLATELHHGIVEHHALEATLTYLVLFAPVWWVWVSHTWFATAFSHDDPLSRALTMLQMAGVLALAATVPTAAAGDLGPFVLAYVAMRVPLVAQWLRAARDDPPHRAFALTYAYGSVVAMVVWLVAGAVPGPGRRLVVGAALAVELATPVLATRRATGRVYHRGHVAERYGLFTIIVLGETILAVVVGLRDALDGEGAASVPVVVGASALVVGLAVWWLYFDLVGTGGIARERRAAFVWGYGHYVLFAAVAAVGAGVVAQLELDHAQEGSGLLPAAAVGVPTAAALVAVAWLQSVSGGDRLPGVWLPLAATACLAVVAVAGIGDWSAPAADLALAGVAVAVLGAWLVRARQGRRRTGEGATAPAVPV